MASADEVIRWRSKYEKLRNALNAFGGDCEPGCDGYGHTETCPTCDPAQWLEAQQAALSAMQEENARLREEAASALRFLEYVSWGPRSPRSARDREEIQHDTIATRHGSYARVTEVIASLRRALSPNQAEP